MLAAQRDGHDVPGDTSFLTIQARFIHMKYSRGLLKWIQSHELFQGTLDRTPNNAQFWEQSRIRLTHTT